MRILDELFLSINDLMLKEIQGIKKPVVVGLKSILAIRLSVLSKALKTILVSTTVVMKRGDRLY